MKFLKTLLITLLIFGHGACSLKNEKTINTSSSKWLEKLPDGSIAYLNNNSEIQFPQDFEERVVRIEGEVFFKVVEKKEQPFIVKTNTAEVEVLGTEFNVLSKNETFELEVDKGEVSVEYEDNRETVKKGEKIFLNSDNELEKGIATFDFKKWIRKAEIDFKRLEREIDKAANQVEDKLEDVGERLNDGKENLKDGVQDIFE